MKTVRMDPQGNQAFLQAAISVSSFLECRVSSTLCATSVPSVSRDGDVFQIIDIPLPSCNKVTV